MKASETRIDKFLATTETVFAIPVYQRNYDWTIKECQQLFNDILRIGSSDDNAHFIGSIVYVHDDVYSATGLNELTIIDGQQRITTITLIYCALYRFAKRIENKVLENKIQKQYLINEFAPETEKLKLKPTENNKEALNHILYSNESDDFDGYSRIVDNFDFFKNHINIDNYEIILKGLSKLVFVDISLDRAKDNPQRIFESLNSTGLDLSQADLIRNYILMGLKQQEQNKIYKKYWETIEQQAKDEKINTSMVSEFIRDFLTLKNKEIPNKKDVYVKFKQKYPTATVEELETVLAELKSLVRFYNKLLNPKNETDSEVRKQLKYINKLDINVAYPFLMKVYEDYSNHIIDKVTFIEILDLIQSFAWRRFIVGLPANSLNKIFMTLYDKVDKENYLFSIQKSLLQLSRSHRFPKDHEVSNALKEKDVYNIKPKNRIYLFERLENYNNAEFVDIEPNEKITIEHIFPQNPDPKWKMELNKEEYDFISENYLHTIGNLTLSGNNGKLGNKPFVEKRDMNIEGGEQGYKYSRLWLNRELQNKENWNKEEVENRAKLIIERALNVWKFPDIPIENITESDEVNIFEADDPNGRKIEYYILLGQRTDVSSAKDFYISVFKQLFDLQPELFFTTSLREKLEIDNGNNNRFERDYEKINDTYYLYTNIVNSRKFDRIKEALEIFGLEDELIIKYQ